MERVTGESTAPSNVFNVLSEKGEPATVKVETLRTALPYAILASIGTAVSPANLRDGDCGLTYSQQSNTQSATVLPRTCGLGNAQLLTLSNRCPSQL